MYNNKLKPLNEEQINFVVNLITERLSGGFLCPVSKANTRLIERFFNQFKKQKQ